MRSNPYSSSSRKGISTVSSPVLPGRSTPRRGGFNGHPAPFGITRYPGRSIGSAIIGALVGGCIVSLIALSVAGVIWAIVEYLS